MKRKRQVDFTALLKEANEKICRGDAADGRSTLQSIIRSAKLPGEDVRQIAMYTMAILELCSNRPGSEEAADKLLQQSVEKDFEELDQMTMARLKKQLQMHRARQKGTGTRTETLLAKVQVERSCVFRPRQQTWCCAKVAHKIFSQCGRQRDSKAHTKHVQAIFRQVKPVLARARIWRKFWIFFVPHSQHKVKVKGDTPFRGYIGLYFRVDSRLYLSHGLPVFSRKS